MSDEAFTFPLDKEQWDKLIAYGEQIGAIIEYPIFSPSIDKFAPAMCKAQAEIKRAKKDSENPFFKSQYADLSSVLDACQEALNKHGLFFTQPPTKNRAGDSVLITRVVHESGQWMQSVISLGAAQSERSDGPTIPGTEKKSSNPVQKTVAEITYLRRACLSALVGVAADDDDGNEVEHGGQGAGQPARPAAPRQAAPVVPTKPGGAPNISR